MGVHSSLPPNCFLDVGQLHQEAELTRCHRNNSAHILASSFSTLLRIRIYLIISAASQTSLFILGLPWQHPSAKGEGMLAGVLENPHSQHRCVKYGCWVRLELRGRHVWKYPFGIQACPLEPTFLLSFLFPSLLLFLPVFLPFFLLSLPSSLQFVKFSYTHTHPWETAPQSR